MSYRRDLIGDATEPEPLQQGVKRSDINMKATSFRELSGGWYKHQIDDCKKLPESMLRVYLGLSGAKNGIKYTLGLVQGLTTILKMLDIEDPMNRGHLPRLEGLRQ